MQLKEELDMNTNRSGFTLMEIMVVIIVIAVLASVAGPMIGSITDQGRSSATKANLSALKSALLSYQRDVGKFPFCGGAGGDDMKVAANYNNLDTAKGGLVMGDESSKNVLVSNDELLGCMVGGYQRRYKGPYMDSNPEEFMNDSWGSPVQYFAETQTIYLRSAGVNGETETVNEVMQCTEEEKEEAEIDDILVPITRVRFKFS
jgi:prepilin-type N-terminal cleavage/methylation domain-containing protein